MVLLGHVDRNGRDLIQTSLTQCALINMVLKQVMLFGGQVLPKKLINLMVGGTVHGQVIANQTQSVVSVFNARTSFRNILMILDLAT